MKCVDVNSDSDFEYEAPSGKSPYAPGTEQVIHKLNCRV